MVIPSAALQPLYLGLFALQGLSLISTGRSPNHYVEFGVVRHFTTWAATRRRPRIRLTRPLPSFHHKLGFVLRMKPDVSHWFSCDINYINQVYSLRLALNATPGSGHRARSCTTCNLLRIVWVDIYTSLDSDRPLLTPCKVAKRSRRIIYRVCL